MLGGLVALTPGAVLAEYTIVQPLGSGAHGVVYLARHPDRRQDVALKVLHADRAGEPELRARFERGPRLEHPNIATVLERSRPGDEVCWLAMRYVPGGDVTPLLAAAAGGLEPARAVRLVTDVARGLDYAHQWGAHHGDLKLTDILVEPHPEGDRAVITDFGLTCSGATPAYTAPERWAGAPADSGSDLYALGCLLYQLLSGRTPYGVIDPETGHRSEPVPPLRVPGLPAGLDAVLATAMAKDPADRYPTGTALAIDALRAVTAHEPTREPALTGDRRLRAAAERGVPEAVLELAHAYRDRGDVEAAESWYRRAVDLGRPEAAANIGNIQYARGDWDDAVIWYRWAIDRGDTSALYNLGKLHYERGSPAEAEGWLRRAVEAGNPAALNALGVVLFELGRAGEAEFWLRQAVDRGDPHAARNLAVVLRGER
ncbi:serine/threonine-protein kinase [Nocardia harenae]|uniref:serine/threonine-protein kinase n=1 Tax=Nocardia harenae TaxID=358707 RepID=UPI001471B7E5|nr:serine/threonine-protein kinase [Nocardia harenae]